jgi:ATP-dependent DNA helicase RecG
MTDAALRQMLGKLIELPSETGCVEDWSAQLIEYASIEDLDEKAISIARENYKAKFPRLANEVDLWDTKTFLNKAKVTIGGKITNTAIVLLGKSESEHYISPAQARLTWILKDHKGEEIDYEHFDCPLLLSVNPLFAKIRNLKYRYIKDNSLFPKEIDMYDPYVIREALHNCIAHQDYMLAGKVIVVEFPKRLVFSNEGSFMPENVLEVLERDSPDTYSRNKFLTNAMFNLNMIDTIGSGIKRMFQKQKERYFPLPEYHLKFSTVSVTIYGQILSQEYAKYVSNHKELTFNELIILDKAQKNKTLSVEEIDFLNQIGFSLQNTEITHNGESEQISDKMKQFLTFCKQSRSRSELLHFLGLKNHSYNYQNHIEPLIHKNWIERTNKDNVKDRNQKYILTAIGRKLIGNGDG